LLGAAYGWWHWAEHRLTVISPGEVYTSGAMPAEKLRKLVKRLGLKMVVDLRGPGEGEELIAKEASVLAECGALHLNLNSPQVPPDELRDRFLSYVADPSHRPALIHCNHGEGRAILYGALWRIEVLGMDPERARKKCRFFTTRGSSFDPRKAKGRYLRFYRPVGAWK